jgi:hypothetical protein
LETSPYNYLAFKLIINHTVIEKFITDNNIDLKAFVVYIKKVDDNGLNLVKNILKDKADIYYKKTLISTFEKKIK